MKRCLFCYEPFAGEDMDFHSKCARKIFGQTTAPIFSFTEDDWEPMARVIIQSQTALTGVQAKLSLHLSGLSEGVDPSRFTIVGLWGGYILKPPSPVYPELPEVEDLTMHLATIAGIKTVPHSLFRLQSGKLAYITKRVDRTQKGKLAMEDMCQLTERLTEDKYRGSYEQIAKAVLKFAATPGLDLINFFELLLFSFISGNADMHLKNFSLLEQPGLGSTLSPAYDLVNTALVNPTDLDELALTLNGRKRKLKRQDFEIFMQRLAIDAMQQRNIFKKMEKAFPKWLVFIEKSFLSQPYKEKYKEILTERMTRLYGHT